MSAVTPLAPGGGLDAATVAEWIARCAAERERTSPPAHFPALPDIPAGRYTDAAFFDLQLQRLWRRSWLYAGHVDQLPEPGSYFVWRHGSAPIVVIRGDDGEIRAFYNTCRHRGAPVVRDEAGRAGPALVCGYHGWSYDRKGSLRGVTDRRDWRDLDAACRGLVEVRCERWANFVFVNEDREAEPLLEFLAPVERFMRHLPFAKLRLIDRREIEVQCHVQVLIDNFLEAYHFRLLHPKTSDRIFDNAATHVHLWRHGHSMMLSPNRREGWVDPGAKGMPEMAEATDIERHHNPSYGIFPNLIVPVSPSGMPCVALWPKTVRTSALEVLWFAPDERTPRDPLWDTRVENFARIVDEDIQFAEPMQLTIESPGFTGVPLNYQERRIYHWHEEADRRIGVEHIAPALRLPARLGAFVE
ncbi:MAG: aromatic ring-hydroxylating dioxygenase subunit alpha [Gammaproteobacteria bacterium]